MRRNSLRSALAEKLREGSLVCLESLEFDSHKTKALETAVGGALGIKGKTLLLPDVTQQNLERAARNNPRMKVVRALGVSIVDLLHYDTIIVSEAGLKSLNEVLAR